MAIMGSKKQYKVIFFVAVVTLLFCSSIIFDIFPFLRGPAPYPPDWQWDYLLSNTLNKVWLPVLLFSLLGFLVWKEENTSETMLQRYEKKVLLFCVVLFFCIQLSVTYFSRAGIGVLFQRIANPDMNGYFTAATTIDNIPVFLRNFNEQVLSLPMHAQGHPPGAILFFWGIEHSVAPFSSSFSLLNTLAPTRDDVSVLWQSLSLPQKVSALLSTILIPFLAALSVIFVYYIGKYLYTVRVGMRAALLCLTIPSLILFIPINDVFLSLFTLPSFLSFIIGIKRESNVLLVMSGVMFSIGIFFSLSILPILCIFLMFLFWKKALQKSIMQGLWFSLGFITLPLLLFLFYGYNTIVVSQTLLSGLPESRAYLTWILFNLVDFFVFLGIPLCMYLCFSLYAYIKSDKKMSFKTLDPLIIGFFGMLLLLNFSGTVRGEVARIWLPFYPFLLLIIAYILTKQFKISSVLYLSIVLLQCIQVLVMQEAWVMLW